MRICIVSQNVSPGILTFRRDLISQLVALGHEVYAFAIDYTEGTCDAVRNLGATPVSYTLNKAGLNPILDVVDTIKLYYRFKEINADVVLSSFVKPSIYASLAASIARVPRRIAMLEGLGYIHTEGLEGSKFKKKILRAIHGVLCSFGYYFADSVIFLNHDDPKDLKKLAYIPQRKIKVLGAIGLKLEDFPFSPVSEPMPLRFIFVGRLLKEKGIREFIDASRIVLKTTKNVEFIILGGIDPSNPSSLSQQQLDNILCENILTYPGHVTNVLDWLAASHVFVLPSYREGFPRSTQEAMAIGRAIITTDVPGCRDTVINEVNGYLSRPQSADDLAEKMLKFVTDRSLAQSMGLESYNIAKSKFNVDDVNSRLIDILMN
ncbi:glycosyltransferase family 4 protein [Thalassolituus sp.]|jgi:glycosyltransferase involved in cell wall biosynthesis|uniref:glycosyltransferase family 4 protein n=1 Tax=Thalassolituus sp. TaxID=2030822 RepID=UPI000C6B1E5B|nr:glycosyltransferase family 4 protein [Thalassolituus sp.]MAE34600.1 glycosyltransferase family 1 protein [Oceanospirillaceae bacterium]